MSVRFTVDGLAALRAELRRLPQELAGESRHIVEGAGNAAVVVIRTEYGQHNVTGNLQEHVVVEPAPTGPFGAGAIVKSTAKHAWLFDNGSQARHYIEKSGAQHETGAMWGKTPPMHTFVRALIRARRQMYVDLTALLERHGLRVTGDA